MASTELNHSSLCEDLKSGFRNHSNYSLRNQKIVAEKNGVIYCWNGVKAYLCATSIEDFAANAVSCDWQILSLNQTIYFEISHLSVSPDGMKLCLWGQHGIVVVHLPRRWGSGGKYEGGRRNIMCRAVTIGDEVFLKHQSLKVVKVAWFPGTVYIHNVAVLSSDNKVRMYSVDKPQHVVLIQQLFEDQEISRESSILRYSAAFGEVAVDFDFGPAFDDKKSKAVQPAYFLQENGDVWLILFRYCHNRYSVEQRGPLTMYPPSDDNYGSQYCSIICLPTNPVILALGTRQGLVHHCIVLMAEEEESFTHEEESQSYEDSLYTDFVTNQRDKGDVMLHVYETIQLDFTLITKQNQRELASDKEREEQEEEEGHAMVSLWSDTGIQASYYTVSKGGLHFIDLPWAKKMQESCCADSVDTLEKLEQAPPSDVKFLLCTKFTESSKSCSIIGSFVTSDSEACKIVCLLSNGEFVEIVARFNDALLFDETTEKKEESADTSLFTSPIRHLKAACQFDQHISRILKRDSTAPLLRSGTSSKEMNPEEFYQVLSRTTQVIREEYVQKMQRAKGELSRRCLMLRDQRERQVRCATSIFEDEHVFRNAELIDEKMKLATENMEILVARLHNSGVQSYISSPVLSNAEKNWMEEVSSMHARLKKLRMRFEETRTMNENFALLPSQSTSRKPEVVGLNPTQSIKLHGQVKEQSDAIRELVQRVKDLEIDIGY